MPPRNASDENQDRLLQETLRGLPNATAFRATSPPTSASTSVITGPTLGRQMSSNRSAALHILRRNDDAMLPSLSIEIDVGWRVI
jgi:hypothetical protein